MKYWKEIRNQRSVWLFAGGFVLLLGVMTGMLCTLGRRSIIPICGITAALLAMAISYTAELRCNIGRRRALENMLADGDTDYLEPEEKDRLLHMDDQEMLEQVFDKLHEVSISRALKTEAELHALQNQINPHFLYNTLEIIRSRAMRRGSADVAEMAEALGMLFRYCINSPGELATLAQELDNVHHYLLIQRYRYGDRFTYEEHIENEDVMDSSLPVMTLQPLVENSIYHGIKEKNGKGRIVLRAREEQSPDGSPQILFTVEDTGVGMSRDKVESINRALEIGTTEHSDGYGIFNVNERIKLYYGEGYGLHYESCEGEWTRATLTIPKCMQEKDKCTEY